MSDKPPKVDRRTAHYQKLRKEYREAISKVHSKEGLRFDNYKAKLVKDGCPHSDTYTFVKDSDDGYGRWWPTKITQCRVCDEVIKKEGVPR